MDRITQDLRYAARKLARTPGFSLTAIATLAIAIGATTAVFSILDRVLLEPLPFPRPERLVFVESTDHDGRPMSVSPADLVDYGSQTHSFSAIAAVDGGESATFSRSGPGLSAVRLSKARVGASFFSLFGDPLVLGRGFVAGEDNRTATKVVVLSDVAWHRYFGGDPRAVGRSIVLDGEDRQIVGIAAPSLTYPQNPDVWVPAAWRDFETGDNARGLHEVTAIARLKDGATVESARRDVQAVANRIAHDFPRFDANIGAYLVPLREYLVGDVQAALIAIAGAVAFVLLIACANIANLFLVKTESRTSEIALRAALGAQRPRLVRQLVTESLLLSIVGTAIGILLAAWMVDAVVTFGPRTIPGLAQVTLDTRALGFAAGLAIVTGLLLGIFPALQASRFDVARMLREHGRGMGGSSHRLRDTLIVAELALAVVLLVGAGLLLRSFERLIHVDTGFQHSQLMVFDAALFGPHYETDAQLNHFADEVVRRLESLPGTQRVAVAAHRPIDPDTPFGASTSFSVDGEPKPKKGSEPESEILPVSPNYFRTLGIQLVHGRVFDETENRLDVPPVIVVSEEFAKQYFPNQDPIGKHLTYGFSHTTTASTADSVRLRGEIVGIVRDVKEASLGERPHPTTYVAYATLPLGATFVVRTTSPPSVVAAAIRNELRVVDPNVALFGLGTMEDALAQSVAQPRLYTLLLGAFAGIALLLATLGVYGVIAYAVAQRTREFGIRIALGATQSAVTRAVLRRGLLLAAIGIVLGVSAALVLTRAIRSMLFNVAPLDPVTFGAVIVVLFVTAVLASWLPARRASLVDPLIAMRAE